MRTIYFDMDGTIADLYGVKNWLECLQSENTTPYEKAEPLCDMVALNKTLATLQAKGWKIGIISWLSKNSSKNYAKAVTKSKKEWLKSHFSIKFDEMHFVKYGTRKDYVAKDKKGILFDDDKSVREKWKGRKINPMDTDINCFLFSLS